jgi:ribose transport system ATP-binding protein
VRDNMSLAALPRFATAGIVNSRIEDANARKWMNELGVRCAGLGQQVRYLSGGNQQKVVIARWLANESKALILDQPTRGVDVGAKVDIYRLLEDLCEQGVAVVMFSLEMPEVLGIADTIYVMCQGEINGVFSRENATQERLMHYAVGCPEEEE